jgi:hypothetical protein
VSWPRPAGTAPPPGSRTGRAPRVPRG